MAGFAPAQDQPDASARDQQEPIDEGPSILSRDSDDSSRVQWEAAGVWPDSGKSAACYDSRVSRPLSSDYDPGMPFESEARRRAVEASFGAAVSRRWRHSKLAVEYRGAYREYATASLFNGLDQFFQLAYSRELERHLRLDLKSTLGTTKLANGEFAYLPISSLDRLGLPLNELFDNRTNYLESRVDLTWQKTARLSFGFGGDGFIVRRQSLLLAGAEWI